jgi:hypothetical protein
MMSGNVLGTTSVPGGGVASTPMVSCTVAILARAILLIRCRMP